jgi:hypothetical protein
MRYLKTTIGKSTSSTTLEHAVEAYAWRVDDWADELAKDDPKAIFVGYARHFSSRQGGTTARTCLAVTACERRASISLMPQRPAIFSTLWGPSKLTR